MGIYDREYYRREGPSYLAAWSTGEVCKWLVIINVVVYIVQLITTTQDPRDLGVVTEALAMKPAKAFFDFQIWRLVTAVFVHDPYNWWHLVWNMLFLWFFGRDMEDLYGSKEFLSFYLTAGVLASVFWGVTTLWAVPVEYWGMLKALGASGAVTAAMVLCALHFPHRTIYIMFFLPVPLWLFTLIYVGGDAYRFLSGQAGSVGVAAHLAGAGFAFLYFKFQWRLMGAWSGLVARARRTGRPPLRVYREEPAAVGSAAPAPRLLDEQLEAKTDAVLEKIARLGKESLTDEEKAILQKASEQYRKKRT
jgi:membrane associated rhomboid family serine protease